MLLTLANVDRKRYQPLMYVVAQTDTMSEARARRAEVVSDLVDDSSHADFISIAVAVLIC